MLDRGIRPASAGLMGDWAGARTYAWLTLDDAVDMLARNLRISGQLDLRSNDPFDYDHCIVSIATLNVEPWYADEEFPDVAAFTTCVIPARNVRVLPPRAWLQLLP